MIIFNNAPAFSVWKNYSFNVSHLKSAMERLSSGLRINQPSDDPAGLGISERFRSQIKNTAMAALNVENVISYIQTKDSWMQRITDMVNRMGELSIQANDGTKSTGDRANIQLEFAQLQQEIARITSHYTAAGKYNGLYLFRGATGEGATGDTVRTGQLVVQVGPDSDMVISLGTTNLSIGNSSVIGSYVTYTFGGSCNCNISGSSHVAVRWQSLICGSLMSISNQTAAQAAVDKLGLAINHLGTIRATHGAEQSRLQYTLEGLRNYEDNIRTAESRIRDADIAEETISFTKYQILVQAGAAMLAQANQLPSIVQTLLR